MEIFKKAEAIKLRSHLDKYLLGDNDLQTIRQSRDSASSNNAIWLIESCTNPDTIRLKNYTTGLYLTASDTPFLLGMTGKKVVQSSILNQQNDFVTNPSKFEWFPIRDGFQMKFKTHDGKFLRANGGTLPWKNSITHDVPVAGATHNWLLWDIIVIDLNVLNDVAGYSGGSQLFGDWVDDKFSTMSIFGELEFGVDFGFLARAVSPVPRRLLFSESPNLSTNESAMDLFRNAKLIRLRSHHNKYLLAEDDENSVSQHRSGTGKNSRWSVELVNNADNIIRLKSCYDKYLTASNQPFLLGMTGRKVLQTLPRKLDTSVEWEPIRVGYQIKLKTRYGNFLRANGGLPPWKNSVTHDVPYRTSTQDWVLWDVDVVQTVECSAADDQQLLINCSKRMAEVEAVEVGSVVEHGGEVEIDSVWQGGEVEIDSFGQGGEVAVQYDSFSSDTSSPSVDDSGRFIFSQQESDDSEEYSPPKSDGRLIYYHIAYNNHDIDDAKVEEEEEGYSFTFKGSSVKELTQKLEEETKLKDIHVCTRSPLNGKLYPLHLRLPPNSTTMHVVVVPAFSLLASNFAKMGILL